MLATLIKSVIGFGTKLLMSMLSEKMIEWFFFEVVGQFVKSTKTKVDDRFFEKVESNYKEHE